jgi:hypothetical protein
MADVHRLTADEQVELRGMASEIAAIERTIAALESIGLPVQDQRQRLETAKTMRDGLLRHFGQPMVQR